MNDALWEWWRVVNGEWVDLSNELDWLSGELLEMAKEYGVHSEIPVFTRFNGVVLVTAYGLKRRFISDATKRQVGEYGSLLRASYEAHKNGLVADSERLEAQANEIQEAWPDDSPEEWFNFFGDVYPSSHLVYVHYGDVESYGIFCASYKDMLDVVGKVIA